jgi:hypothetical protein
MTAQLSAVAFRIGRKQRRMSIRYDEMLVCYLQYSVIVREINI